MTDTAYGIDLETACTAVVDDMRTEDPDRTANLSDPEVVDLARNDFAYLDRRGVLAEIADWVHSGTTNEALADAYRAVLTASAADLDTAI